jgi:hypothetical protein
MPPYLYGGMIFLLPLLTYFGLGRPDYGTTPGELVADPPTLRCLGFRWLIAGDDNAEATVAVSYRKGGASDWREAQPMLRVHRGSRTEAAPLHGRQPLRGQRTQSRPCYGIRGPISITRSRWRFRRASSEVPYAV